MKKLVIFLIPLIVSIPTFAQDESLLPENFSLVKYSGANNRKVFKIDIFSERTPLSRIATVENRNQKRGNRYNLIYELQEDINSEKKSESLAEGYLRRFAERNKKRRKIGGITMLVMGGGLMVLGDSLSVAQWGEIESSNIHYGAVEKHIECILRNFPDGSGLRIVVDCGCGATSVVTPHLLRELGCEVVALNCSPSGFFLHPIEPTESNLGDLIKAVKEFGADLGIAHDGDGDRMMAVDDKGRFVSGDKLLAIFARTLGAKEVVTTIDASMAIDEMGFNVRRTRVGDTYVSEELKRGGDFGGEPSGSWVFPNISLCPDGIYAAAQVVAIVSQQKLSQLVDSIPYYPLLWGSISSDKVVISSLEPKLMAMEPKLVTNIDGIKLNFEDGWLLIRASGTEPKIRVSAEAKDEARARQLYDGGIKVIKECIKRSKGG